MIKLKNVISKKSNFELSIPTLCIDKNQKIAIIGHNGSGKSTFLNLLLGQEKFSGELSLFDRSIPSCLKEILPKVSYCFQNPDDQLFCANLKEDILFAPHNFKFQKSDAEILSSVVQVVPVSHLLEKPAFEMSYGEKKNATLAVSLATNPELLLLDEPFAMLDQRQRRNFLAILKSLKNVTLLFATHEYDLAYEICDQVLVIDHGKLAYFGDKEVLNNQALLQSFSCI